MHQHMRLQRRLLTVGGIACHVECRDALCGLLEGRTRRVRANQRRRAFKQHRNSLGLGLRVRKVAGRVAENTTAPVRRPEPRRFTRSEHRQRGHGRDSASRAVIGVRVGQQRPRERVRLAMGDDDHALGVTSESSQLVAQRPQPRQPRRGYRVPAAGAGQLAVEPAKDVPPVRLSQLHLADARLLRFAFSARSRTAPSARRARRAKRSRCPPTLPTARRSAAEGGVPRRSEMYS